MCANDECIPTIKVCDGIADCEDNSDELQVCRGNNDTFVLMHEIN